MERLLGRGQVKAKSVLNALEEMEKLRDKPLACTNVSKS